MNKKKPIYLALLLLTLSALVLASVMLNTATPEKTPEKASEEISEEKTEISISFDYGDGKIEAYSQKAEESETLFELMHRMEIENKVQLSYKNFSGLGVLIESIGEKKNGEGGAYWQYRVNNEYAKVGASEYIPKNGDAIQWKFTNQKDF